MGLLVGPIRQSFEISDTQFSLLAGLAFSLFYAIMGLPLARIADPEQAPVAILVAATETGPNCADPEVLLEGRELDLAHQREEVAVET